MPGYNDLILDYIFVPEGGADPVEWKAQHPDWIALPATFVWHHSRPSPGKSEAASTGEPTSNPGSSGPSDVLPASYQTPVASALQAPLASIWGVSYAPRPPRRPARQAAPAAHPAGHEQRRHPPGHRDLAAENIFELAKVMETEARGLGDEALTAVGWTAYNRMLRNHKNAVHDAWHGFVHGRPPTPQALRIAGDILSGRIVDPIGGATHFYTPERMPKDGDPHEGKDVKGGLEPVPGITRNDVPIESYRPGWANDPNHYSYQPVRGVPETKFKFYRQNGDGPVR